MQIVQNQTVFERLIHPFVEISVEHWAIGAEMISSDDLNLSAAFGKPALLTTVVTEDIADDCVPCV